MTVSTAVNRVSFAGDDATSVFPLTLKYFADTELLVVRRVNSTGVETTLALDIDYTVTVDDPGPGGDLTLLGGALASGLTLIVITDLPYTQEIDLETGGNIPAQVLEEGYDRATILIQQCKELLGRSLKLLSSSSYSNLTLPDPVAGKYLGWKNDLSGLDNFDITTSGELIVSALGEALVAASTAGAMQTLLEISTFVKTILDDETASDVLTTLGVSTFIKTLLNDADAATARATLAIPDQVAWLIDIDVFETPGAQTNWSTLHLGGSSYIYSTEINSSGAQNALISWPVVLSAGTWTFSLVHNKDADIGIYSVQLDGVEKGTIDGYAGAPALNTISTITGIVVAASGKATLMLKMATKNASSSSYFGKIQHARLIRTA
jgi:hypothetical protein